MSPLLQSKEERTNSAPLPVALQLPTLPEADKVVLRAQSEPDRERTPSLSSAASAAQAGPGALPGPVQSQGSSGRAQHGSPSHAQSQMVHTLSSHRPSMLAGCICMSQMCCCKHLCVLWPCSAIRALKLVSASVQSGVNGHGMARQQPGEALLHTQSRTKHELHVTQDQQPWQASTLSTRQGPRYNHHLLSTKRDGSQFLQCQRHASGLKA